MKMTHSMVLAGILSFTGIAFGQESNAPGQEIIVSASRERSEARQIPANVTVITPESIQESESVSLVDVIKNLDGIYFRSTSGDAVQAAVAMRGFGENSQGRVLVLVDGRRLNRPDMAGINWTQIPLNMIERIEVLHGSQSALYGDNAVGGVINIITKKGTRLPEYSASVLAGSYGLNVERLSASGTTGPLSYAAQMERNQADGYRDRSAYLTAGGGASVGYDINEWNQAALAVAYDTLDCQLPGGLTKAQMEANPRQSLNPNNSANSRYFNTDLGLKSLWSDNGRFDLDVVFGRKTHTSDMTSWSSFADTTIDSPGITPRFTFDQDLFNHPNKFLVGLDGYLDRLDVERFNEIQHQTLAATAAVDKRTIGAYARNDFHVSDPLILGAGIRQEQARIAADVSAGGSNVVDNAVVHNANALDASLTFLVAEKSKLFTRAGTVFRFPFVDEQVNYIGYSSDKMYTDIEPEKGQNYEAGTDLVLGDNLNLGLTLFLLNMQDEIAYNKTTYRNENLDDTRREGAETYVTWTICKACAVDANYTYTTARFVAGANDGNTIPLVPEHKASLIPKIFLPWHLSLNAVITYVGTQYLGGDNANAGAMLPAYTTVDLALRYTPQVKRMKLETFVGVDNVGDEQYASVGYRGSKADSYYPSPERTYKAGVSCRF